MDKSTQKKDEFGRILCPNCKKPYYYIKRDICSACLAKSKPSKHIEVWKVTNEALKEINDLRVKLGLGETELKLGDEVRVLIK